MKFNICEIPNEIIKSMMDKSVWTKNCPIDITRLKLLELSHYNFDYEVCNGQMVTLDKVSKNVLCIFQELFSLKFPIHSIKLMDEFDGNDKLSMSANNSSCFNFRNIEGTNTVSMHSYGLAIDVNPVQNPYIITDGKTSSVQILPEKSTDFLNRTNQRAGMVEPIVKIFAKHGFSQWGGDWKSPIDYHHFQTPRDMLKELKLF